MLREITRSGALRRDGQDAYEAAVRRGGCLRLGDVAMGTAPGVTHAAIRKLLELTPDDEVTTEEPDTRVDDRTAQVSDVNLEA